MARTEASIRVLIGSSGEVKSLAPLDFLALCVWEQVAGAARRDEGDRSRANPISAARYPQQKWGPALLPAPTAPSEGSAGVRNLVDRTRRPTYPLSILAHQLRRRFPSNSSLLRGAQPIYSSCNPEDCRSFDPSSLTRKSKPSDVLRPFLGRSLLRPALLLNDPRTILKPRRA